MRKLVVAFVVALAMGVASMVETKKSAVLQNEDHIWDDRGLHVSDAV